MKSPFLTLLCAAALTAAAVLAAGCGRANASVDPALTPDSTTAMTDSVNPDTTSVTVKVETNLGAFTILLYGDTPRHRDNFVKLVNAGYYNGTIFHRVINQFMVQAGDPDSRTAAPGQRLGAGSPGYTIEAEIMTPRHFHKRYALAAARQGDQVNPQKRSSGSQFYIVTGQRLLPAQLDAMAGQMRQQQMQAVFNGLAARNIAEIRKLQAAGDTAALKALEAKLVKETEDEVAAHPVQITDEMKEAYSTVGGTPHLDGGYTVFGEVIAGQDVIDKIEKVETDSSDRPREDVKILSMSVVK